MTKENLRSIVYHLSSILHQSVIEYIDYVIKTQELSEDVATEFEKFTLWQIETSSTARIKSILDNDGGYWSLYILHEEEKEKNRIQSFSIHRASNIPEGYNEDGERI